MRWCCGRCAQSLTFTCLQSRVDVIRRTIVLERLARIALTILGTRDPAINYHVRN